MYSRTIGIDVKIDNTDAIINFIDHAPVVKQRGIVYKYEKLAIGSEFNAVACSLSDLHDNYIYAVASSPNVEEAYKLALVYAFTRYMDLEEAVNPEPEKEQEKIQEEMPDATEQISEEIQEEIVPNSEEPEDVPFVEKTEEEIQEEVSTEESAEEAVTEPEESAEEKPEVIAEVIEAAEDIEEEDSPEGIGEKPEEKPEETAEAVTEAGAIPVDDIQMEAKEDVGPASEEIVEKTEDISEEPVPKPETEPETDVEAGPDPGDYVVAFGSNKGKTLNELYKTKRGQSWLSWASAQPFNNPDRNDLKDSLKAFIAANPLTLLNPQ